MRAKTQTKYDPITEPDKLRARALYWLGQREFSIKDFRTKLEKVCELDELIDNLLEDFISRDWLNEQRYMESFVRQKLASGLGLFRIKQELQQHGIKSSDSELYFEQIEIDWFEQALNTYQKKYSFYLPKEIHFFLENQTKESLVFFFNFSTVKGIYIKN